MFSRTVRQINRNLLRKYNKVTKLSSNDLCHRSVILIQGSMLLQYDFACLYGKRLLCSDELSKDESNLDQTTYEKVCSISLDALNEYIEELLEHADGLLDTDISYSDGVLTVKLGSKHGTYVINRQMPNRQIWLSSPRSGPKRYDFVGTATGEKGKWVYRHNGQTLHQLLQEEFQPILKNLKLEFEDLPYGR